MVTTANLATKLNKLTLKNPIITASGTFGYADEYNDFINVKNLGAIVTKAITLEPRKGNKVTRIFETNAGMINSIGLENMGISAFLENVLPKLKDKQISFIVNIAGATAEEYIKLAQISEENKIMAIELNLSCPNVKSGCMEFGTNENSLFNLIRSVRETYTGTIIAKLTPNVTAIEKIAVAAQKAGADAISAINTVKATGIDVNYINGNFYKKQINGGLSGKTIKPIALRAISSIKQKVDIPIIGMGGIYCLEDLFEFIAVGADAFQIGTANFTQPDISENLVNQLSNFIERNNFKSFEELKTKIREDICNE